jgi:hypothetical protein
MKWLKNISFANNVYPERLMDEYVIPTCMFVPSKEILRKMIKTAAKCNTVQEMRETFNAY